MSMRPGTKRARSIWSVTCSVSDCEDRFLSVPCIAWLECSRDVQSEYLIASAQHAD